MYFCLLVPLFFFFFFFLLLRYLCVCVCCCCCFALFYVVFFPLHFLDNIMLAELVVVMYSPLLP